MGKENLAVNRLLERKEIFADLINGTIFKGKQVILPEKMELISSHSGVLQRKEDGRLAARERSGDIRMKVSFGMCSLILANETQEKVHYAMPIRNMLYDALEYTKQVQDIEKRHKEAGDPMDSEEFLSGLAKEDFLEPVITTVLFLGDKWEGPRGVYELLKLEGEEGLLEEVKSYIPNYHINLICAGDMEDTARFRTCLQHIFNMVQYKKDRKALKSYIDTHKSVFDQMDSVEAAAVLVMLGAQKQTEKMLNGREDKEGTGMLCQALEEMIEEGREQGIEQGEAQLASLMKCLMRDNRQDLMTAVLDDILLRKKMYQQYNI